MTIMDWIVLKLCGVCDGMQPSMNLGTALVDLAQGKFDSPEDLYQQNVTLNLQI